MGQRHQAWIIAQVKPHGGGKPRYRCIGGLHHQWCYGSLPLKGLIRIATLLKQKPNAEIVQEELRSIEGKYGSHLDEAPKIPNCPCRYTTFLLNLAFNADLDSDSVSGQYFSNGSLGNVLPASWGCWDGDNNDGLTIIDVTDPYNPRYCFLGGNETETEDTGRLTAQKYLEAYYDIELEDPQMRAHLQQVLDACKGFELIDVAALREAFPSDFKGPPSVKKAEEEKTAKKEVPSLTSLTLGPVVKQAVQSGELEAIEPILIQADKLPQILEALRVVQAPFPDSGLAFVSKVIEATSSFEDLKGIQLSGEQLTKVIPVDISNDVLDLSGNAVLTADGLRALLAHNSKIRRLVLFRTAISNEDMYKLLETPTLFGHIEELVHPLLISWKRDAFPATFTLQHVSDSMSFNVGGGVLSVPIMSLNNLAEGLGRLVAGLLDPQNAMSFGAGDAPFEAALSTGHIPAGKTWGERAVWCTPVRTQRAAPSSWTFVLKWASFGVGDSQYGLINTKVGADGTKAVTAHSAQSFLDALQEEGYPAPSEAVAQKWSEIFDALDKAGGQRMSVDEYKAATTGNSRQQMIARMMGLAM
ncbi:uncharacterized protein SCHCODRAFT_02585197 [Schizophyllum commune H4-8]|nr:uncharacterized protein SCHCODRAFT_02585197 [Schizophyllum commune H4-8]KAI5889170.1 hypothetical protein SCHCODRAFT_02585197 [Schizophyllum commune H4-8]